MFVCMSMRASVCVCACVCDYWYVCAFVRVRACVCLRVCMGACVLLRECVCVRMVLVIFSMRACTLGVCVCVTGARIILPLNITSQP